MKLIINAHGKLVEEKKEKKKNKAYWTEYLKTASFVSVDFTQSSKRGSAFDV